MTDTSPSISVRRQLGSEPVVNRRRCVDGPLAQLERAPGYEPGGRRFESCEGHVLGGDIK